MLEHLHIRFPHLSVTIFDQLDDKSLSKCREVCKSWLKFIDEENFTCVRIIRIIKNHIECYDAKVLQSASVETLSKIACCVRQFYKKTPRSHGQTLLHFAAMTGQVEIIKEIFSDIMEKNPADSNGMTPYHFAAKHGQLEVCQLIMGMNSL